VPILVRLHGPWCHRQDIGEENTRGRFNTLRVRRELLAMRSADCVTVPCTAVLRDVETAYGEAIRGRVIPNPQVVASEKHVWSLENCEENTVLFIGRFDSLKGGDL